MSAERGAPPSRTPTGPAGPRGPRRLEPEEGPAGPRRLEPGEGPAGLRGTRRPEPEEAPGSAPPGDAPARAVLGGATPASRGPRRLAPPRPARVRADATGRPLAVAGRAVEAVRESWLVEDRWWTDAPLRRRYWEVVTADGRDVVVFRDLQEGRWYGQR
ncbi:collagen-like domain-containing protein [Candidatus Solirubrobacter pratensis]|uniref:hypothetical protein n=1 Tax=Candidatus Solirubrobacter pratensis TaxID=1298857 RepID=UPI00047FB7B9|nr:hypothetical protein [Candidatus Solirubrobacter pratensis]